MCFSRITSQPEIDNYSNSYKSHHDTMETVELYVPVLGIVFSVGILLHDLKAYAVNKIFVDKAFQEAFAKATYNGTEERSSGFIDRCFAVLNILTCGIVLPLLVLPVAIHKCCCGTSK